MTTVLLLSGGIDSSVLLHHLHEDGVVRPLFIDYGQRAVTTERAAAEAQCRALGLELSTLDVSTVGTRLHADSRVSPHSPLPLRNLVLASLALSFADRVRARSVATAIIRDDLQAYACTSASFWYALRDLGATLDGMNVETPFIYFDKLGVLNEGARLGVDFALTYSCMLGREQHCGTCRQCVHRRRAMARAGITEPADFYAGERSEAHESAARARAAYQSASGAWRW